MASKQLIVLATAIFMASCAPIKKAVDNVSDKYQYHAGFYLYDPANQEELLNINGDKYFTPASNTKVYTFYSSLTTLPDSIPAFRYTSTDSVLYVWGLADPGFLNPLLPQGKTYDFLSGANKISFSEANFFDERFGAGWAWDDYPTSFSQERTAFPVYGNSVVFDIDSSSHALQIVPSLFRDSTIVKPAEKYRIGRTEFSNRFEWDTTACKDCERLRPIHFSNQTLIALLEDTLKVPVVINPLPLPDSALTFYSIPKDSLLKVMMRESDNFMAESLLLSCAAQLTDSPELVTL